MYMIIYTTDVKISFFFPEKMHPNGGKRVGEKSNTRTVNATVIYVSLITMSIIMFASLLININTIL